MYRRFRKDPLRRADGALIFWSYGAGIGIVGSMILLMVDPIIEMLGLPESLWPTKLLLAFVALLIVSLLRYEHWQSRRAKIILLAQETEQRRRAA